MAKMNFNSTVAARTRAANEILETPDLVAGFEELGGLQRDLVTIRDAGLEAEAANLGQSQFGSAGKGATVDVLAKFSALKKEYSAVMAVLQASRADLSRSGAPADVVVKVDGILSNEAQVTVKIQEEKGEKKRKARKSVSQEALRAEIAKDAGAMLDLTEIHPNLAERRVPTSRLEALRDAAEELAGLLGARAAAKGAAKASTKAEHAAVSLQREIWGATYRILSALGRGDERVRSLLSEAAR